MMVASTPPMTRNNKRIDDVQNAQTLVINRGDPLMQCFDPRTRPAFLHVGMAIASEDISTLPNPLLSQRLEVTHERIQIRVA